MSTIVLDDRHPAVPEGDQEFKRFTREDEIDPRVVMLREEGATPVGISMGLIWFIEPVANTTCAIPLEGLTIERVRQKLESKRLEFGLEVCGDDTAEEMIERIMAAIQFITARLKLPKSVISDATMAATREIAEFQKKHMDGLHEQASHETGA